MRSMLLHLAYFLLILAFSPLSFAQDFDFFYFVQQWPGSYCDTQNGCCYPKTGKPDQDFGIHGLWPNYNDGSYPSNCDPGNQFDPSQVADLTTEMQMEWPSLSCPSSNGSGFWSHEWDKHGTCSESVFEQHGYFEAALKLKKKVNLLQVLTDEGIHPDGSFYSINSIRDAIRGATGYEQGIECNRDESGNSQLYQIYLCVSSSGSNIIQCPTLPKGKCSSQIKFPSF
ncbi:ribonuclease 1-like [Aristolochia californica]|uniref:ribonuclease 1-like n=1 Tax=Aristolochia californica TaxID=171875 RepID=UPI0035D54B9D